MKIMRPIVVFTNVAAIGTLSQKAQNAGIHHPTLCSVDGADQ